jgi:catechol 2,3-dioxygenase-like lactoylglutathione lyase family enzyme
MPVGGEPAARAFYQGLLGIPEVSKPAELAGRGGCWFERGTLRVHLGVEAEFRPARKAHPALLVDDLRGLARRLSEAGHPTRDEGSISGHLRMYVEDPFRNRIELIDRLAPPSL